MRQYFSLSRLLPAVTGLLLPFGGAPTAVCSETGIDFNTQIRPLLSNRCFACHGPDEEERSADLRLDRREDVTTDRGGYATLVPGDPEASELIYRIATAEEEDIMPPPGKGQRFSLEEVALIKQWITEGGHYDQHWSYQLPVATEVPEGSHPVDYFIQARLAKEGLSHSPEADRPTLARRVALDLTGIPPTWEEVQAFVSDQQPDAYERFVDTLLAKPVFGERWARVWLDLARYADSAGYADDPPRTIWAYRDWVIRAFNRNLPFDQFTLEQIAGDLLPDPTEEQRIATAFHRNTLTNNEGGTDNEEFRNVAVVDRVNTTMAVWMGTTIDCAQCHTHKYDPITQEEYFRMFAIFNQSEDADQKDERPFLKIWTSEQEDQKEQWGTRIAELESLLETQTAELSQEQDAWMSRLREEPDWIGLRPISAEAVNSRLLISDSGAVRNETSEQPETDRYSLRLELPTSPHRLSALRLKVPAEQKSNFVLSQLQATYRPDPGRPAPRARYVRVELPGKDKHLHLAEIEVFQGDTNVALSGSASQSSTDYGGLARFAIDGNTDGDYAKKSVTHTARQRDPWLEVDLKSPVPVDRIVLWNRSDGGQKMYDRLKGFRLRLLDENRREVWQTVPTSLPSPSSTHSPRGGQRLSFGAAYASYEQNGFPAASVLAAKPDRKTGWAVGGATGKEHELTLILSSPLAVEGGVLDVTLRQESQHHRHLLTRFSLQTTTSPQVSEWARMPDNIQSLVRANEKTPALASYYRSIAPSLRLNRQELVSLKKQLQSMQPHTTVPVMRERTPENARPTHIQIRGNFSNLGAEVTPGTPAVFHPLRDDLPPNRLALAHWLVDPANPLTARVIANRYWEQIFGIGIVETSEEFGSQGELPSHPQLLDWLAIHLVNSGWDLKAFLKLLVTSASYRQDSRVTPHLEEADPFNRLYARGPRFRVSAEMVRDQALFVSGLLHPKMFGPPVKPPQPSLGLKAAFGSATDWETSKGEDRYRRALYTTWRRSSPYPSMATFDAPNREICTVRRSRTNTPLQALVTLNDPVYVEAAQALAGRILATDLTAAFRQALSRDPSATELSRLQQLYDESYQHYSASPEQTQQMIQYQPDADKPAELAAWTVVANVLLNLDEMFLKR